MCARCLLPPAADFIVLSIPAGEYVLDEVVTITRSRVVLRGEGRNSTALYVPYSAFERAALSGQGCWGGGSRLRARHAYLRPGQPSTGSEWNRLCWGAGLTELYGPNPDNNIT